MTIAGPFVPIAAVHAQTTTLAVTATSKDGTAFTGTTRSAACRRHGGVKSWGTAAGNPAATAPAQPSGKAQTSRTASTGTGQVWVNTASSVYHCPGTRWHGKTKQSDYMSDAQAKAQGARPDHGKARGS
jgi:hypothetical protein